MNKNLKLVIMLVLLIVLILIVFLPYTLNQYRFLIGFDSGLYLFETQKYLDNQGNIMDTISLWNEPGLFILTMVLNLFIDNLFLSYKLSIYLFLFLISVISFLISKKLTGNMNISLLVMLLMTTSLIQVNSFYLFLLKQIISFIVFLFFIYILNQELEKYNDLSYYSIFLLVLFSSFILFTHRAISFLWVLYLMFNLIYYLYKRNYHISKKLLIILILPFIIVSPYYLKIIWLQFKIFSDFITLSLGSIFSSNVNRDIVGVSIVKGGTIQNPLINYLSLGGIVTVISLIGLVLVLVNGKKIKIKLDFLFLTIILIVFTIFKFNFSNRFILNLDFFMIIFSGAYIYYINMNGHYKSWIKVILTSLLITFLIVSSFNLAYSKKPYITHNMEGIGFINNNIPINNSLVFAPDYIDVILAQEGYETVISYYPLRYDINSNAMDDKLWVRNDNFLVEGHNNLSLINDYNLSDKNIYVIFGTWNVNNPLPSSDNKKTIPLEDWDNSLYFEKIYEGNSEVFRIYKYKSNP